MNIREQEESDPEIKQWVKETFPQLCIRVVKSKNHTMRTHFNQDFIPIQQKGRRIPVHLQERVEWELNKLIDQKHIVKLNKCLDRRFISLIVITVKRDQIVELALDSKKTNKCKHKKIPNAQYRPPSG